MRLSVVGDAVELDDVYVLKVRQQLRLAIEVVARVVGVTLLEGLDGDERHRISARAEDLAYAEVDPPECAFAELSYQVDLVARDVTDCRCGNILQICRAFCKARTSEKSVTKFAEYFLILE